MSIDFTPEQLQIRDSVERLCADFGDDYWLARDADGKFPEDFCRAIADNGYMGIAMPVEYGGSGLGITEAAILMQAISQSGAGNGGVSSVSLGIFGLNPIGALRQRGTEAANAAARHQPRAQGLLRCDRT